MDKSIIMTIDNSQFQELIKNIPSIDVNIEWDGCEGKAELEGEEVSSGIYLIFFDATVNASGTNDPGDYWTPPYFSVDSVEADITTVDSFIEDIGEEIEFTEEQVLELIKAIKSNISV